MKFGYIAMGMVLCYFLMEYKLVPKNELEAADHTQKTSKEDPWWKNPSNIIGSTLGQPRKKLDTIEREKLTWKQQNRINCYHIYKDECNHK